MESSELKRIKEKYADFIAGLSDEQKAKVDACETVDELTKLASESGVELPDEILEAVSGGSFKGFELWCVYCKRYVWTDSSQTCPTCGAYCRAKNHN